MQAENYYRLDSVPEFWDWLAHQGMAGKLKVPREIWEEVKRGNDDLAEWCRQDHMSEALLLDEAPDPARVQMVHDTYAQGRPLDDIELEEIGADPLLIGYALMDPRARAVVTTEAPRPRARRANRKIPDICRDLGIECIDTFELTRRMDFKTDWNR